MVGHERLIKGFKCYCYIDHKNNIFSDAQLDNRRRSKKLSNWALELQQFNIDRVWIRGEAIILADAPSRAPWEARLAQFLPIPDMPVRDLVVQMYQDPEGVEELVSKRRKVLTGDQPFEPLRSSQPEPEEEPMPFLDDVRDDQSTATFGVSTPDFGSEAGYIAEEVAMYGEGRVLFGLLEQGPWWPR